MTLKTRKPTGAVPWPLILIEGEEKAGKTWSCAELTASERVGRCFWIDLGEGAADEYGAIPGARYEIVEHDGSFAALLANVTEIRAVAGKALEAGEKPVVLIIDTMTDEWDLLKDWASDRAKSSKANRAKLAKDPNAEITVSGNYWNDANSRHRNLMRLLKTFPGIVLMTSHGKVVATIGPDGQPVEGKKEHKVEAQKSLGADASCWIRLYRTEPGVIVGGRSVHLQFRPGEDPKPLARDWTVERIIFDVLKCDPATAHVRDLAERKPDTVTPEQIVDEALRPVADAERVREMYREAKRLGYDDVTIVNERQAEELLLAFLVRTGNEKFAAENVASRGADEEGNVVGGPGAGPVHEATVVVTDEDWFGNAQARIEHLATVGEIKGLWAEIGEMLRAGKCTKADADRLADMISARAEELKQGPAPAAVLTGDDEWLIRIRDITSGEEADMVRAELAEAFAGAAGDDARAVALFTALDARAAEVTQAVAA